MSRFLLAIILGVALLSAGSASAQDEDVETQRFQPRVTSGGYLQSEGSDIRGPIDPFSLGLWLSYARNPLIVIEDDGSLSCGLTRAMRSARRRLGILF